MDAFFASIEQLDHPSYRGKPVVVGALPSAGRGVVSAASYEARKFGIHSAQPIVFAYRACPDAIFVTPRMERYIELSRRIMTILGKFSPLVEPLSVDEAFLDCTGMEYLFATPRLLAEAIVERIHGETALSCSIGIAPNKFIAKIASDLDKPGGITICDAGTEKEFLARLPLNRLWGVGEKTRGRLESLGLRTIGDLARERRETLARHFGKSGEKLWLLANGIDDRPVQPDHDVKSISEETTFPVDTTDTDRIEKTLLYLCDSVARRTRKKGLKGKTVVLKIRFEGFETHTRRRTVAASLDDLRSIRTIAIELYNSSFRSDTRPVRLIGVGLTNLVDPDQGERQLSLFESPSSSGKSDELLDRLQERFGNRVHRASLSGESE